MKETCYYKLNIVHEDNSKLKILLYLKIVYSNEIVFI